MFRKGLQPSISEKVTDQASHRAQQTWSAMWQVLNTRLCQHRKQLAEQTVEAGQTSETAITVRIRFSMAAAMLEAASVFSDASSRRASILCRALTVSSAKLAAYSPKSPEVHTAGTVPPNR